MIVGKYVGSDGAQCFDFYKSAFKLRHGIMTTVSMRERKLLVDVNGFALSTEENLTDERAKLYPDMVEGWKERIVGPVEFDDTKKITGTITTIRQRNAGVNPTRRDKFRVDLNILPEPITLNNRDGLSVVRVLHKYFKNAKLDLEFK